MKSHFDESEDYLQGREQCFDLTRIEPTDCRHCRMRGYDHTATIIVAGRFVFNVPCDYEAMRGFEKFKRLTQQWIGIVLAQPSFEWRYLVRVAQGRVAR